MTHASRKDPQGARTKTVFLVDDHPVVRKGLQVLIDQSGELKVCGTASSAQEALSGIASSKPDLVVIDLSLQGASGLELLKSLSSRVPELPVLILSMHDETLYAARALRAGAKGYIMKREAIEELIAAVQQILSGRIYVSPRMSDRLLKSLTRGNEAVGLSPVETLSDRELEIFELIGDGHGAKYIARELNLSVSTIETYKMRLKEKLKLRDAEELFQHALSWSRHQKL
jgi:DNA-binding NarL/FixJ family response regulator